MVEDYFIISFWIELPRMKIIVDNLKHNTLIRGKRGSYEIDLFVPGGLCFQLNSSLASFKTDKFVAETLLKQVKSNR